MKTYTTENTIPGFLQQIEKEKEIKILLACETGSRAWGFPSPDSDFDVRLIYMHRPDWYLSLTERKDSIEIMLNDREIDISGWDLRKALRLLIKSNPPLLERIQSPIIYKVDTTFLSEFNRMSDEFYSRISTIHHYLSMAKKMFDQVNKEREYNLKKLFYTLRTATACKWITEKEEKPPIVFPKMLSALGLRNDLVEDISRLVQLKATKSEAYFHQGEARIFDFIASCIEQGESKSKALPGGSGSIQTLDDFFLSTIKNQWT